MKIAVRTPIQDEFAAPVVISDSPDVLTDKRSLTSDPKRVIALDGLRGLAILGVFLFHFGGGHQSRNPILHVWSVVTGAGWMGVDLFFVLSGFLITGILFDTAHTKSRMKNFYARRALRIFPLFYGVLFGFLLLTPVLHLHWRPGHLLYFFYLSNMTSYLVPGLQSPGDKMVIIHFWSLAVEEQFYLLWPFVVWSVLDRVKLLKICLGIMLLVLALRVGLVMHGVGMDVIFPLLPTRADSLICGGALALLVRGQTSLDRLAKVTMLISGVATFVLIGLIEHGPIGYKVVASVGYTFIALFFTCLVYFAQNGTGWIARIGTLNWLRFLGRYSYGLYIYQGLLLLFLMPLVYPLQRAVHSVALGGALFILLSLGLILAISMLSYHFFEAPILKLKSRFV
jgi:peptidoglycan/LPS O-acetylase OafA/YrhL